MCLLLLLCASTASAKVPAGIVSSDNISRIAYARWKELGPGYRSTWLVMGLQSVSAITWLDPVHHTTQLTVSELRCEWGPGEKTSCNSGYSRGWQIPVTDFFVDPFLDRAEITYGSKGRRLVWQAVGDPSPFGDPRAGRKIKADPANLWMYAQAGTVAGIERSADVRGHIAGQNLKARDAEAGVMIWVGSWSYAEACLLDHGEICN